MRAPWARVVFGVTAACAVAGVALSVVVAVRNADGHFPTGVERGFNAFAFFTIQSNLLVAVTSALLAWRPERRSASFRAVRLMGLVGITLTGVVFHVALGRLLDLDGVDWLANQLVHTVVPLLAVGGWLAVGPRGLTSPRTAALSVLFPAAWLAFTLVRGALVHWYPYPFLDVDMLGYGKAVLNCVWVAALLAAVAAAYTWLDELLGRLGLLGRLEAAGSSEVVAGSGRTPEPHLATGPDERS